MAMLAPVGAWLATYGATAAAVVGTGISAYEASKGGPKAPQAVAPPSQDTAANAAQQQADILRKRRGIFGNITGAASNPTPQVAGNQALCN